MQFFVKTWKWLKLFNSVPFIKETQGNHVLQLSSINSTDFGNFTVNEDKPQN